MAPATRSAKPTAIRALERVPEDATTTTTSVTETTTTTTITTTMTLADEKEEEAAVPSRDGCFTDAFRFPVVVALSFCMASMGYSFVGEWSRGQLAALSRSQTSWAELVTLATWRVFELALAWFGGLDALDVAMLDFLVHGPLFYLQATFYSLGAITACAALLVDVVAAAAPFYLLRPLSAIHRRVSRAAEPLVDLPLLLYTSALAGSIYTIVVALSLRFVLPRIFAVYFPGLPTLEPAYTASYADVLPATGLLGAAASAFIYAPSATTPRDEDDEKHFDPVAATLGETVRWNLWGYSSRVKVAISRTAVVMLLVGVNTYLACTRTMYGVEGPGAAAYAAVWVVAAMSSGLALGLVGGRQKSTTDKAAPEQDDDYAYDDDKTKTYVYQEAPGWLRRRPRYTSYDSRPPYESPLRHGIRDLRQNMATGCAARAGVSGPEDATDALPADRRCAQGTSMPSTGPVDGPLEQRADPDAQTTVTDFLDFTEYLPSDMMRSLTLIGKLDRTYTDASILVNDLTMTWGQLPSLPALERPDPVKLRAAISENLDRAVSSRVYAHSEAVRMSENVTRHYNKAMTLLAKLLDMMDNYPAEEPKSPVAATKSPQVSRARLTVRSTDEDGKKIARHRIPRITVPGEVLAPYDIEYDTCSDDSDDSSDTESDGLQLVPSRRTPAPGARIKIVSHKTPKSASRPARQHINSAVMSAAAAANAAALLHPPPENAVIGSADAPWLQLTHYELAKLRKRMKKNATWTPSDTMVARELKALKRGPEEYREAKKKAEEEGRVFNPIVPSPVVDNESGSQQLPAGALSADSLAADDHPTSNRGMKLNEAKKLKREALAKLAAEEAEESARKMARAAKLLQWSGPAKTSDSPKESGAASSAAAVVVAAKSRTSSRSNGNKRKREVEGGNDVAGPVKGGETPPRPIAKRTKTETPVLPPQPPAGLGVSAAAAAKGSGTVVVTQSETPVPIPVPPLALTSSASPPLSSTASNTVTMSVPTKPPAAETPVPLPRKASTCGLPAPTRDSNKRETRGEAAKRQQQQQQQQQQSPQQQPPVSQDAQQTPAATEQPGGTGSSSRGPTPTTTPSAPEPPAAVVGRRSISCQGQAVVEPATAASLAADRPRRTSTARNTPAPEAMKQPAGAAKRAKRPAPGVVSITSSGGNSAVGKRKAAPRKKARATKREKGLVTETEMEEVDDEGNPIDPNEPRYCLCNRVSFGTMIQCDSDNCKQEWFHLECVGLADIPARTTRWYCPDCRRLLNIGEKGEVNARGVKK
ncbi:hypothetical protein L249_6440 [Ophiocordyceps polyrhachis-furcata BCC 54312]|uniref:PHD-type domain-containing protein n=1 Tax=Ophiocordyceps polyrhachis-furcata BCC 54312 TaxID=1330021 RepID=A0A367LKL6_9HYPO|nr:hypothetical protein L249_6440 [Ophiocordyceps polyrhachis-furcata BCC 54312]